MSANANSTTSTTTSFAVGVAHDVRPYVKQANGMSYIPWASSLAMAGNPIQAFTFFTSDDGAPSIVGSVFGGSIVALEQEGQQIVLPIQNDRGGPLPREAATSRDVGDAMNRCRARAAAMMNGVGLCLYAGTGNGPGYARALRLPEGVDPTTLSRADLMGIKPLLDVIRGKDGKPVQSKPPYLGWHAAWAVARLTDPAARFRVLEFEGTDPATGEVTVRPALRVPGMGWMVAVEVTWRGQRHVEYLPIMGPKNVQTKYGEKMLDHQPLESPTSLDWHRAVMRCLAKGLAITSGYGYSAYAKEYGVPALDVEAASSHAEEPADLPDAASPADLPDAASPADLPDAASPAEPVEGAPAPASGGGNALVAEVETLIQRTGTDAGRLCAWLGVKTLAEASDSRLLVAKRQLERKAKQVA